MSDFAEPNDPWIGRVLAERYRLDSIAGRGGTGAVYRATHLGLGRQVAVKLLHPALVDNETAVARFRREAKAASRLSHPNCVQVLDFGTEANGPTYLVMELLEGRELFRVIYDDWPLSTERIVSIMGQVLSVLGAAHELGIVHRDLKPENIMLVTRPGADGHPEEVVKVTDFGIAKGFSNDNPADSLQLQLTREGAVAGTPEYMSPEQARGEPLDGRCDLYACGVIVYEMLTGTLPFGPGQPFDVLMLHLTSSVVPPSQRRRGIDRRLEPVVLHALVKDPEGRFADARAMREAMLAVLALAPQLQPPEPDEGADPTLKVVPSREQEADTMVAIPLMQPKEAPPSPALPKPPPGPTPEPQTMLELQRERLPTTGVYQPTTLPLRTSSPFLWLAMLVLALLVLVVGYVIFK